MFGALERRRTRSSSACSEQQRALTSGGAEALALRLELAHSVAAHSGCVNRLCWSADGALLASGSDDRRLHLWDARARKSLLSCDTGHRANIFGVRFLGSEGVLATCAMDGEVRVHQLAAHSSERFICHENRVKAIDVDPSTPSVFFSASEDGTCRLFDEREGHRCRVDNRRWGARFRLRTGS